MISNWAVLDLSNVRTTAVRRTFTVDGRVHVYNMDKFILIIERWTFWYFYFVCLACCLLPQYIFEVCSEQQIFWFLLNNSIGYSHEIIIIWLFAGDDCIWHGEIIIIIAGYAANAAAHSS